MDEDIHFIKCPTCGELIDLRDLSQVMSHEGDHVPVKAEFAAARKVGDPEEWIKGNKIDLN